MILANSAQHYEHNLPVIVGRWVSQITAQSPPCQATPATSAVKLSIGCAIGFRNHGEGATRHYANQPA